MKYSPFLPLGFLVNNLSDSVQNKVITILREKTEKPIKLLWQVENKQDRELYKTENFCYCFLLGSPLTHGIFRSFFKVLFVSLKRNWKPTGERP